MSLRSIIVFVIILASSIQSCRSASSKALDVALVINSVPYSPPYSQSYWRGLDALDGFLRSFAEQIFNGIVDVRVAVVSAYIEDSNDASTTSVKVIHAWSDIQTADAVRSSFLSVVKPPAKMENVVPYEAKKLFDDIKSSLFTPENGDRAEVPNIVCLVGLKYIDHHDNFVRNPNGYVRQMEEFEGMFDFPIRLIVISFVEVAETNYFVGFLSVGSKKSIEPVVGNAIETGEKMAEAVRKVVESCEWKSEATECYYDQYGDCVQEHVYKLTGDSDPNYCRREVAEASPCEKSKCEKTCDSTIKWSDCDCDKDLETKIRDGRKGYKLYQFCTAVPSEKRKCANRARSCADPPNENTGGGDGGSESTNVLAITLGVVFGVLSVGVIGLIVFLVLRRQRRRRRQRQQSPHHQRGNDRRGKKPTDSRNVGARDPKSRTPSTRPTTTMDRSMPRRSVRGGGGARTITPSTRR